MLGFLDLTLGNTDKGVEAFSNIVLTPCFNLLGVLL